MEIYVFIDGAKKSLTQLAAESGESYDTILRRYKAGVPADQLVPKKETGEGGGSGATGATFTPSVDADGNLSWTNDKGLDNPEPVNIKGSQGKDGNDGVSPTVSVTDITGGHRITITDSNGTKTVDVIDGGNGQDGKDGTSATHSWSGTVLTITSASGTSSADLRGEKGADGSDATVTKDSIQTALGYTPANVEDVFEDALQAKFTNIFDAVAIEYGKYLNINNGEVSDVSANLATTDFIPCKANDIFRVNEDFPIYNTGNPAIVMYDSNKERVMGIKSNAILENGYYVKALEFDENGYVRAFQVLRPSATTAYVRICNNTTVIGKNPVLTINEEIAYEIGYGTKLNPKVRMDYSQLTNAPSKNGWSILPYERLNIAYSSIGRKPINTVEHFTDAAENYGYNALKCDVRPTSDGELVCCHDAGFTFNSSGKITSYNSENATPIISVAAATVLGYSFPTGEHPCLVGDFLEVCRKHGKVAFITIRNEYMDVVIPKLREELSIHNMTFSSIINCMTYNSLVTWRTYDQSVMINYTLNAGEVIDKTQIDRAVGLGYCSLCGFGLNSSVVEPSNTCDFDYARDNGIRLLQAIAYQEGSPEACYAMGYDGCQIAYAWNHVSTGGVTEEEVDAKILAAIGSAIGGSY